MRHSSALESHLLQVGDRVYTHHYLIVDLSRLPLLEWLNAQTLFPKVYWQSRCEPVERAAVGSLLTVPHVPILDPQTPPEVRFFGGRHFASAPVTKNWNAFPSCAFWLPEFEVVQEPGRTYLLIHDLSEEPDSTLMRKLKFELPEQRALSCRLKARSDSPALDQWELLVARALFEIEEDRLEKVVLARKTRFLTEGQLEPLLLLASLRQKAHLATLYGFQFSQDSAFIGSTPEMLYQRMGDQIHTDALAGTRPRGATEEENLRIQEELLTNTKDRREFSCVKQWIHSALQPLCSQMHWEPYDRVVTTSHVQHIHNRLHATLHAHITDQLLIDTLHPTPALGGKPREEALEFIQAQEPFQRGWYGAPIGWISAHAAEIAVGIRSALVCDDEINLFAGTGIVKGSHSLREWEELEHKITPFKQLFL